MSDDEHRDDEIEEETIEEVEHETSDSASVLENLTEVGEQDLRVYSLVLTMGNVTTGDLVLLMGNVEPSSIDESLSKLKQKKMIVELPGIIPRYKATPPFEGLSKEVEQISEKIGALRNELKEQIRTASVTVRDAYVDLTKQNLSSIEEQESDVASMKSESASSIESSIQTMKGSAESSAGEFDTKVKTTCDDWKNDIGSQVDQSITSIQNHVASTGETQSSALQELVTDVKGKIEHHRSELELKVTSFETASKDKADKQAATVTDVLGQHKEMIASTVGDSVKTLSGALQRSSSHSESTIKSTFGELSSSLTETHESFERYTETASKNIEEKYDSLSTEFKTAIGGLKDTHEKILNDYVESHAQELSKLAEKQAQTTDGFKSGVEESMTEFKATSNSIINSLSDHVGAFENRSHSSLTSAQQSMQNLSTSAIDASYQTVTDTSAQTVEELRGIIDRKKASVKSALTEIATRASQEISETINREITNLESELDRFHQDVSGNQEAMIEKIDQDRRERIGDLESSISEITEQASSSISTTAAESKELIASFNAQLIDAVDRGRAKSISHAEDMSASTRVATNTLGDSSRNLALSVQSQVDSESTRILSEVGEATSIGIKETRGMHQQLSEDLAGAIESTRASMDVKSSEINGSSKTAYMQSIEQVNTFSETAISDIVDNIDDVKGKVAEALGDLSFTITEQGSLLRSRSNTLLESFASTLDESLNSWTLKNETSIAATKTDTDSLSKELKESISSLANELKAKSVGLVTDERTKSLESFEKIGTTMENTMSTGYARLEEKITKLKNTLKGIQNKLEESPMLGLTESTLESAFTSSAIGDIESQDVAKLLSSIWERVSETDFPGAKKTWTVVTRTAVATQVADMIGRAKSKVTLIVPKSDDIPTAILSEMKSTVGVEVVVTEDSTLKQKAGPLIGRGNIRIRVRQEKDVYACVRDSEEVLIAPAASVDHDVIGMVSEDEGFIKFIMGVVGPIFMGKARLLKPGDI